MIGDLLSSRYELTALIGEGPIFKIYAAKDRLQGREVSLRLFKPPFDLERGFVASIGLAIQKTSGIHHPGVERLEGVEVDMGKPFVVGQLSPDLTLADRIRKLAPFSKPVSVQTVVSILEGLGAVHEAGIIHGDLSAQNIVIGADGSARLQLAGIWEAYSHSQTAGQVVLPSMAAYLAPEVSSGSLPSKQSDVYAVGVILFELLCGHLPFAAETPLAMAFKHATAPTPILNSPDAPEVLIQIVKKAMDKDPGLRYENAFEMLGDLRLLQDALRFGKVLTWPIKRGGVIAEATGVAAAAVKAAVAPVPKTKPQFSRNDPHSVAPRLNSVKEPSKRKMSEERDVPGWLVGAIGIGIGAVLAGSIALYILFNFSHRGMVTVPNLKGKLLSDARQSLQILHLNLKEVSEKSDPTAPIDTILESDPKAGEKVVSGATISVVVNSGPNTVQVPDLKGMTVDEATAVLKNVNLLLQQPVSQQPSLLPQGQVTSQDPPAKQSVQKGSQVRVAISNGQPPAPPTGSNSHTTAGSTQGAQGDLGPPATNTTPDTSKPTDQQKNFDYFLTIKVTHIQAAVELRVDISDSLGQRPILEETHDPNDVVNISTVSPDANAKFLIYYDGVLKQSIKVKGTADKSGAGTPASPSPSTTDGGNGLDSPPGGGQ